MEPNRLEEQFRDKLEQRTIQPSKMAWDRLDAMLSVNEEKEEKKVIAIKKPNRNWMYMAGSFVLFATIGAFFLTRGSGSNNSTQGTGTSVVNTEKTVQPEGTSDMVQPSGAGAMENLSAPAMKDGAVASNGKAGSKQNYGRVTVTMPSQPICGLPIPQPSDPGIAEATPENVQTDAQKNFEAEKLLAANHPAPKKKSALKVDAGSLLSSVEGELDESFRDKALNGVIKNFNTVRSSVANRNYQ
ncbi:hypothetical protein [Flavobacterium sp.]|uniref:hypothetical protein n=1 Tax=Flavobacterium sp. TaxID=239 RepID=UPI0040331B59